MKTKLVTTITLFAGLRWLIAGPLEVVRTTGQSPQFRVHRVANILPDFAQEQLHRAHGGFAVDRRPGKGEIYFAIPGAGIVRINNDLRTSELFDASPKVTKANLHNTLFWSVTNSAGKVEDFLTFPSDSGKALFTTDSQGNLLHELTAPTANNELGLPAADEYFRAGKPFVPTDVERVGGLLYVTTGYSPGDFCLTARIMSVQPMNIAWNNLTFGGKGDRDDQFRTGHGITLVADPSKGWRLAISDRPVSKVKHFSPKGQFLDLQELPKGSLPCDVYQDGEYTVIPCLDGPDKTKGAPIYLMKDEKIISTLMLKEDLGLREFTHVHNAVSRTVDGVMYIFAQAWNPGGFVILKQAFLK